MYVRSSARVCALFCFSFPCQSLDEFIYLLLDHGYDDLSAIAQCNPSELEELKALFSTEESKKSIQTLVEAIGQLGIGQSRRQNDAAAAAIELVPKD